jgi:hypothetical protein
VFALGCVRECAFVCVLCHWLFVLGQCDLLGQCVALHCLCLLCCAIDCLVLGSLPHCVALSVFALLRH